MFGLSVNNINDIHAFIASNNVIYLEAISVGSVFFGALTYIGNGPNFMVKAIAEQQGVKMPSFFQYIAKYSIPILLPVLLVVWLLFFM
jgi:Na+/H+ antiporter NhaD/arsenite permease-like protein